MIMENAIFICQIIIIIIFNSTFITKYLYVNLYFIYTHLETDLSLHECKKKCKNNIKLNYIKMTLNQ